LEALIHGTNAFAALLNVPSDGAETGIEAVLNQPQLGEFILADIEGRAVGFLFWSRFWRYRLNAFYGIVQNVWVERDYRGKGVCEALFGALKQVPILSEIRLALDIHNQRALRAYRRLGFKVTGYSMECSVNDLETHWTR
jgi:ribosomal protein S18 acetylase RimI-like enzyme